MQEENLRIVRIVETRDRQGVKCAMCLSLRCSVRIAEHTTDSVRFNASVRRSPGSEIVSRKAAEERLEIALCRDSRVLSDFEEFPLGVGPCRPVGQALSVGIAGLCEIRPVRLNQVRKRRIFRSKWHPMPDWVVQRAEHQRNFKTVKCAQVLFSLAGDRTIKSVRINALTGGAG